MKVVEAIYGLIFLFPSLQITASSRISKREERTDLPTDFIEGIEGLVNGGNEVINGITEFLQKSPPGTPALDAPASDRAIPILPGLRNSRPGQLSVPGSNSDDPAAGSNSRSTTEGSNPQPPSATTTRFECDTSNNPCKESVRYIIFPLGCDTVAGFGRIPCNVKDQNDATTAMLIRIVGDPGEMYISKDDDDGVFLWALPLSTREVEEVRSAKDKVRAVVPDRPIQPDQLLSESISSLQNTVLESQLKKRLPFVDVDDRVISQRNAPSHLCTISRAKNKGTKKTYDYFESAGQEITVYNIDSGANPQNKYIKIRRWIYGPSVINQRSDYANGGGHGSCTSSLICGSLGVAKKANIIVVKTALWISDWLDSWQKIINDIRGRERRMEPVRGYNIVTCQISIIDYDDEVKIALQKK